MKYTSFIKALQDALIEEGIRISQDKLKTIFETMANVILDNIKEEEKILLHQFICFKLIDISPRKLPNGNFSPQQYGVKIELSDVYKKKLKERLNK